jgi:hypothetical protein
MRHLQHIDVPISVDTVPILALYSLSKKKSQCYAASPAYLRIGTVLPSRLLDFLIYHIHYISFSQLKHTLYVIYIEKKNLFNIYIYTYIYTQACACVCVCVCVCVYMHLLTHVCICVCMYIYTYIHTYTLV